MRLNRQFSRISKNLFYSTMNPSADYKENYHYVQNRVQELSENKKFVQLVAVSKTKPPEAILSVYEEGHRHFGENYVNELVEKAPKLPDDIQWHFIGHLQSNKLKQVLALKNLWIIETVDRYPVVRLSLLIGSISLAKKISKECEKFSRKINIYIQVNTSNEPQKSGVSKEEMITLAKSIFQNEDQQYGNVVLKGLMTIGKLEGDPREDFQTLIDCRKSLVDELGVEESTLDLSMGMSGDYDQAILMGSTNVRVGSLIFGERVKKNF